MSELTTDTSWDEAWHDFFRSRFLHNEVGIHIEEEVGLHNEEEVGLNNEEAVGIHNERTSSGFGKVSLRPPS